jgi:hypothetical protein
MHYPERSRVDSIDALTPLGAPRDNAGLHEHSKVLRHERVRERGLLDQATDRLLATTEDVQKGTPVPFGDGVESI